MNASIRISRRAFAGGLALLGLGGGAARAQGFAGLGENAEGFAAVVPGRTFAFPADHGPHPEFRIEWWYVTANLKDADRRGLWRAVDAVSSGHPAGRAAAGLGQPADLDGPRRRDVSGYSSLQRSLCARRRRPGRRRGKAVSRLDRCLGNARARWHARRHAGAARPQGVGRRFHVTRCGSTPTGRWCCRATPATAGNRNADRPRIITASRFSR